MATERLRALHQSLVQEDPVNRGLGHREVLFVGDPDGQLSAAQVGPPEADGDPEHDQFQ